MLTAPAAAPTPAASQPLSATLQQLQLAASALESGTAETTAAPAVPATVSTPPSAETMAQALLAAASGAVAASGGNVTLTANQGSGDHKQATADALAAMLQPEEETAASAASPHFARSGDRH